MFLIKNLRLYSIQLINLFHSNSFYFMYFASNYYKNFNLLHLCFMLLALKSMKPQKVKCRILKVRFL